jgi:hypothetical protein
MVKPWSAPSTTGTSPAGLMLPPAPAEATMVQVPMVKSPSLSSAPVLPAASRATTRSRAVPLGVSGTVHRYEPLLASPVAMTLGKLAPPSVE